MEFTFWAVLLLSCEVPTKQVWPLILMFYPITMEKMKIADLFKWPIGSSAFQGVHAKPLVKDCCKSAQCVWDPTQHSP